MHEIRRAGNILHKQQENPAQGLYQPPSDKGKSRLQGAKKEQAGLRSALDGGSYSASVTLPHRLGVVLIFSVPVHAISGMYVVPGQG